MSSASTSARKGVLLVNLGTPDSPKTGDVRKYLREFLSDPRVIDINPVARFLLVNLIIAPFRAPKSAKEYKKVWTEKGSPLLFHSVELSELLQQQLDAEKPGQYKVALGMRYQTPSIDEALKELQPQTLDELIVIPLFPQYASATTGSVQEAVMKKATKWQLIPKITFIDAYPALPKLISAYADNAKPYMESGEFDHIMFSYHGLPQRQLRKADPVCLSRPDCCAEYNQRNRLCYRAQCYETSRHLATALNLKENDYTVSFQSRLGRDPWIQPYTDEQLKELAGKGYKNLLVFSPSFVADCLETTVEIGEEYAEDWHELTGGKLQLVSSANTNPLWVNGLADLVAGEREGFIA